MTGGAGRGWGRILGLVLVTAVFSVVPSTLLIFVPLALMLAALPPWRPGWVVVGLAGLYLVLSGPGTGLLVDFGRGWSLIVGGWFVVAAAFYGAAPFLKRGLVAVAGGVATVAAMLGLSNPAVLAGLDRAVRGRMDAGLGVVREMSAVAGRPGLVDALERGSEVQALLYPAMLGVSTLAGLAVAWWLYRRLTVRVSDGLSPLREFRFADGWVWVLIGGLALLLLPLDGLADRAGGNLLVFMAALYALRGAAVLLVVGGSPGVVGWLLVVLVGLLLYPLVMIAMFAIGLSDTWLDLRTRRARPDSGA